MTDTQTLNPTRDDFAALFGPVGSVVVGGIGTLLVAAAWIRLFPDLARRDRMR